MFDEAVHDVKLIVNSLSHLPESTENLKGFSLVYCIDVWSSLIELDQKIPELDTQLVSKRTQRMNNTPFHSSKR